MTIEQKLKNYILSNYKSVKAFSEVAGMPYTTVVGIMKRGVANAGIGNINRICETLGISADELAQGRITPAIIEHNPVIVEMNDLISITTRSIYDFDEITLDGVPMTDIEIQMFLDTLEIGMEMIKRMRRR